MHLVSFIIRIYHDARSPERQTPSKWVVLIGVPRQMNAEANAPECYVYGYIAILLSVSAECRLTQWRLYKCFIIFFMAIIKEPSEFCSWNRIRRYIVHILTHQIYTFFLNLRLQILRLYRTNFM